jgi:hypothetical protein
LRDRADVWAPETEKARNLSVTGFQISMVGVAGFETVQGEKNDLQQQRFVAELSHTSNHL